MQLQPQVLSFLRFNAPQYQYKPSQQAKIHEKKYLQMYYKTNPDSCFVQLVETLFSDRYLYQHKKFRELVEQNKKGFVNVEAIFQQQLVKKFLKQMGDEKIQKKEVIQLIKKLSTKLICNRTQVRRKYPFVNKLKLSKPLYMEEFPQNDGNEELQTLLQNTTNIYKISYKHSENWAQVFAQDPDKLKKLNGHFWSIKTYFRVMSYQRAKEIFDNVLEIGNYELKNFCSKSIFTESYEDFRSRHVKDSDDQLNFQRNIGSQQQQNGMDDEHEMRQMLRQRYFRQRRRPHQRQRIISKEQKERKSLLEPNFEFNAKYLVGNTHIQNSPISQQRRLTQQRQKEIEDILLKFFEQQTVTVTSNNNMEVQ